jgi:predicted RNA-binding Zn-ribbon protein involved in translation (DUF1610 family)
MREVLIYCPECSKPIDAKSINIRKCPECGNVIKAYQCQKCEHLDIDDVEDKVFCGIGYWKGSGEAYLCKEAFKPVEGRGMIGAHR